MSLYWRLVVKVYVYTCCDLLVDWTSCFAFLRYAAFSKSTINVTEENSGSGCVHIITRKINEGKSQWEVEWATNVRGYVRDENTIQTPSLVCVSVLSVANFSLKSNIKTAKVSPAVCCRGRSEHMDLKSMPTRDTFSISMYILGVTTFTCMTVHVSQGHVSPFLPSLPCLIEEYF